MEAQPAGDDLEAAVDAAIAACDGNVRATIRALIVSNSFLHARVEHLTDLVSPGFARGKLSLLDLP
jgi:predicted metalloprotease